MPWKLTRIFISEKCETASKAEIQTRVETQINERVETVEGTQINPCWMEGRIEAGRYSKPKTVVDSKAYYSICEFFNQIE